MEMDGWMNGWGFVVARLACMYVCVDRVSK